MGIQNLCKNFNSIIWVHNISTFFFCFCEFLTFKIINMSSKISLLFWINLSHISIILNCYCSVAQSCLTLCDPKDCSKPGFSVLHCPLDMNFSNSCSLSQWCHPTISSSVVSFSSYLQSFPGSFPKWVNSSHLVTKVLMLLLHRHYFQWTFRVDFL